MKNAKNAGRKPKFKKEIQTIRIVRTIPMIAKKEVIEAIEEVCDNFKI